jgi:glycosyltransferase involved in cell wall biosynthesis
MTARSAELALATTVETQQVLQALGCRRVSLLSHAALPADEIRRLSAAPASRGGPFRILSVGRLLHWKGYDLGIRAFHRMHRDIPEAEYWIVGDGPERRRLEQLAAELGLSRSVVFRGAQPRSAVAEILAQCDVLLHPSLHDSGAWVCVEAMASSRPVVCLDCGGPAVIVTDETGFKIQPVSPGQVVRDLAAALALMALDPNRRQNIGSAARRRAEQHLNWDRKGEWLSDYMLPEAPGVYPGLS